MAQTHQKILVNGIDYDLYPAQVVSVDYSGLNKEYLYSIRCKLIGPYLSISPGNIVVAKPMDINIKNIPISGEIVMLLKGPTAYSTPARNSSEFYYTNAISIQGSINHNGLPGVTEFIQNKTSANKEVREDTQDGITVKTNKLNSITQTIDPLFQERLDVFPLQPYPGDILIEGRFGQSIRFGSTVIEDSKYQKLPYWRAGSGDIGNPILIISNGTNPEPETDFNSFILENVDTDDSSIWLTSGQSISFTPASNYLSSMEDKGLDLFKKNGYAGNQIILASDRIVLNARKQEIVGFSSEGIAFSSDKVFSIDSREMFEIQSSKINLGINAEEPALMGNTTGVWLNDLCNVLKDIIDQIKLITVPTGVGPSGTPINSGNFTSLNSSVQSLANRIDELKSSLVFLNKTSS